MKHILIFPGETLPLYFTFANTPTGQKLAEIHDKRPLLVQDGRLKQMFSKWHLRLSILMPEADATAESQADQRPVRGTLNLISRLKQT